MTTEQLESTVSMVTKSEDPFMVLFTLSFICGVALIIWMARFFNKLNTQNQETIKQNDKRMEEQRLAHREEMAENNRRSERREKNLLKNLQDNTDQLREISNTLKEVQFNFTSLENKVTENFHYLNNEISNVKSQISSKTDHKE